MYYESTYSRTLDSIRTMYEEYCDLQEDYEELQILARDLFETLKHFVLVEKADSTTQEAAEKLIQKCEEGYGW